MHRRYRTAHRTAAALWRGAAAGPHGAFGAGLGVDAGPLSGHARSRIHVLVNAAGRSALQIVGLALRAATDLGVGSGALRLYRAGKHGRDGKCDRRGFR